MTTIDHFVTPEELMAFRDGELPFERAAAIRAHVLACPECQRLNATLESVSDDLARWRVAPAPASLTAPPISSGAGSAGPRTLRWRPRRLVWALGIAGTAAAAVFLVGPHRTASPVTPPAMIALGGNRADYSSGRFVGKPGVEMLEAPGTEATFTSRREMPSGLAGGRAQTQPLQSGPFISRTARLTLVARGFDTARSTATAAVADAGGTVTQMNISGQSGSSPAFSAVFHVPAARLDEVLAKLKTIGRVVDESQTAEDVTEQIADIGARLANSRNTERRLNELLLKRTGSLADVLAAEREVARVREEVERLDAQRQLLDRRVTYAVVHLLVSEERKSTLTDASGQGTEFRNAVVDGARFAYESFVGVALFVLRVLPAVALWAIVLAWPLRWIWRRRSIRDV
jgi:Domain of unknown function (DUF4349)/Putative zinc-finger